MNILRKIELFFKRRAWERTVVKSIARTVAYGTRWSTELSGPIKDEAIRLTLDTLNVELDTLGGLYPDYSKVIESGRYEAKKVL